MAAQDLAAPLPADGTELTIPELVAQVYDAAPPPERERLLAQLLRPLGLLSLAVVAGGAFVPWRLRQAWPEPPLAVAEPPVRFSAQQVTALVDFVQQVSAEAIDGLARLVAASPDLSGSAAAVLLMAVVLHRASR